MTPNTDNQPVARMIARGLIAVVTFFIVGFATDIIRSTYSGIRVYPSQFLTIVGLAAISLIITLVLEWSILTLLRPKPDGQSSKVDAQSDVIESDLERCIKELTANWLHFRKALQFKDNVPLADIISAFAMPSREFVRQRYPGLSSQSDQVFWTMIRKAIIFSGTEISLTVNKAVEIASQRQN